MRYIINSFNFSETFNYFLQIESGFIYIRNKYCFFKIKIPSFIFLKIEKDKVKFLFTNYFYFITFLKLMGTHYQKLFVYFFFVLNLRGLGYRIRKLSKHLIKIFLNRSNYYYMHISEKIIFKYRTRRLFFFGNSYTHLYLSLLDLIHLKKDSIYRIGGILYPNRIFLIKPGKNKFR